MMADEPLMLTQHTRSVCAKGIGRRARQTRTHPVIMLNHIGFLFLPRRMEAIKSGPTQAGYNRPSSHHRDRRENRVRTHHHC